jgi:hypothetical protein
MSVTVLVNFRQRRFYGSISKEIELATYPTIGMYFEYEDGWGLAQAESVSVLRNSVEIDVYGPQFTDEELDKLVALGWTLRRS